MYRVGAMLVLELGHQIADEVSLLSLLDTPRGAIARIPIPLGRELPTSSYQATTLFT